MERTKAMDRLSILKRKDKAMREIGDICAGRKKWSMSIPHDFNYDSDDILTDSLDDMDYLLAENASQLARIAELERKLERYIPKPKTPEQIQEEIDNEYFDEEYD